MHQSRQQRNRVLPVVRHAAGASFSLAILLVTMIAATGAAHAQGSDDCRRRLACTSDSNVSDSNHRPIPNVQRRCDQGNLNRQTTSR